jgi:deoxycytidylate deaminase
MDMVVKNGMFYKPKGHRKLRKKLSKTNILVYRETLSGITNSKPCSECIKTMKDMGIRGVYYSTDEGVLVYEKMSDICSTHKSQMTRHIEGNF